MVAVQGPDVLEDGGGRVGGPEAGLLVHGSASRMLGFKGIHGDHVSSPLMMRHSL